MLKVAKFGPSVRYYRVVMKLIIKANKFTNLQIYFGKMRNYISGVTLGYERERPIIVFA